jgi:hypothetical protein
MAGGRRVDHREAPVPERAASGRIAPQAFVVRAAVRLRGKHPRKEKTRFPRVEEPRNRAHG